MGRRCCKPAFATLAHPPRIDGQDPRSSRIYAGIGGGDEDRVHLIIFIRSGSGPRTSPPSPSQPVPGSPSLGMRRTGTQKKQVRAGMEAGSAAMEEGGSTNYSFRTSLGRVQFRDEMGKTKYVRKVYVLDKRRKAASDSFFLWRRGAACSQVSAEYSLAIR